MFSFFKKKYVTAYFKNGVIYDVVPKVSNLYEERDVYYNARYIITDGKRIDLENIKSIHSIPAPKINSSEMLKAGVTSNLVYVLRMKASNLKREGKIDVALALLKKLLK